LPPKRHFYSQFFHANTFVSHTVFINQMYLEAVFMKKCSLIVCLVLLCSLVVVSSRQYTAVQAAAPAIIVLEEEAYRTLPDTFPKIDVLTEADGTDVGVLFLANFNWRDFPNSNPYLLILDDSGEPVFAQPSPHGGILMDFKPQPNGQLSYFDRSLDQYIVLDQSYTQIDTITAGNGYDTDLHELILMEEGHAILMIYDEQVVDMSDIVPGGNSAAVVTGLVLQELDGNDNVIFEWQSWDHFHITDATVDLTGETIDYAHGNSIEVDTDGHWIISSRHMDEVTKINRQTGEIIWRFGGKNNQFAFADPSHRFSRQHDVRRLENGNLLLFDNNVAGPSRAIEFDLDETAMTATAVRTFNNEADLFSRAMGSSRRLPNGNTLVGWGSGYPTLTEFRQDGSKALELAFDAPLVSYRAYRAPWQGLPVDPPTLMAESAGDDVLLFFSWNGATDVAAYEIYGGASSDSMTLVGTVERQGFETAVRINDPGSLHHFQVLPLDLSGEPTTFSNEVVINKYQIYLPAMSAPNPIYAAPAESAPAATHWVGNGSQHVFYRGPSGRVHELWYSASTNWRQNNIGQNAPRAVGNPAAYVWPSNRSQHVIYRDEAGQIHELWYQENSGWRHNNLSQLTGAPAADSDPFGMVWPDDSSQHIFFRGQDNHLYELWKKSQGWQVKDLTVETDAPPAQGVPHAYVWGANNSQHLLYRGTDRQIYELWFSHETGWRYTAVSQEAQSAQALGDPIGVIGHDQVPHLFYRGIDGRIDGLTFTDKWRQTYDTRYLTNSPLQAAVQENGDVAIAYRSTDNNLYQLTISASQQTENSLLLDTLSLTHNAALFEYGANSIIYLFADSEGHIYSQRGVDMETRQRISQLN
jgi:hypothetical protein